MPNNVADIWAGTLDLLRGQMTKAMYNDVFPGSRLIARDEEYTIELQTKLAVDWAENRLRPVVERAIALVAGTEMKLEFVVAQPVQPPLLPEEKTSIAGPTRLAELDYRKIWFGEGTATGYTRHSNYTAKFWGSYLGRAYSLWSLLLTDNRQNKVSWTRDKKYRYKYLSRALGTSPATISGGLRPCACYEKARLQGKPLTQCCGRYTRVKWEHQTAGGTCQCLHWNRGLLEILYDEGLLAVELREAPDRPNSHVLRLQAWMLLPILTPKQVLTLSDAFQLEHERWLETIARQAGFDIPEWEAITEPTLVPWMAGYDEGRMLIEPYHPNPLT